LSDFAVHFTPEHVGYYEWRTAERPEGGDHIWFGLDDDAVAKELLMLAANHRLIFHVFDRCLDGNVLNHADVERIANRAFRSYKDLLEREHLNEELLTVGERW
jgi:hypothetical protein